MSRPSLLFSLDEGRFFLDESPFFLDEIPSMEAPPETLPLEEAEEGMVDYDGPLTLFPGEPLVIDEGQTIDQLLPRPRPPARPTVAPVSPLRWELLVLVGSVYMLTIGGLLLP